MTTTTYRIDELAEEAASALVATGTVPPSARVSALPDRRMLRYYTTLGLLDRPTEVRGRTAYYGRRHLLQIVAIKRLQAAGASLAEVQHRLAGVSTTDLERIADLPPDNGAGQTRPFWQAAPVESGSWHANRSQAPETARRTDVAAVRLGPGVTLVLDAARPLSPADHDAVRAAAGPLLDHLMTRGLVAAEPQER
ncbi:MAG: MerR family transcriptional regulator [Acidimicrobiales bacterium]